MKKDACRTTGALVGEERLRVLQAPATLSG